MHGGLGESGGGAEKGPGGEVAGEENAGGDVGAIARAALAVEGCEEENHGGGGGDHHGDHHDGPHDKEGPDGGEAPGLDGGHEAAVEAVVHVPGVADEPEPGDGGK